MSEQDEAQNRAVQGAVLNLLENAIISKVIMKLITDIAETTKEGIPPQDREIAEKAIDAFVKNAQRELN